MENLLVEIEKSMHEGRSLSVLNNGGFGYNSFHNYSLNPSVMPSRGSLPIISPPHFYSSFLPPNHRHQPPLLPLPTKSSMLPPTNKKRKKKKQQQQKQRQLKPGQSDTVIPKPEAKTDVIEKTVKKEEEEEDTEEVFLIVGSLSKTAVMSAYTSISPPPPSSVPMPRLLLKPKINKVGSCNAEADDLRRLLHL